MIGADKEATPKITPEMIKAGLGALEVYSGACELGPISQECLVKEVWAAMYREASAHMHRR